MRGSGMRWPVPIAAVSRWERTPTALRRARLRCLRLGLIVCLQRLVISVYLETRRLPTNWTIINVRERKKGPNDQNVQILFGSQ